MNTNNINIMNNLRTYLHYYTFNGPTNMQLLIDYINMNNEVVVVQDINFEKKAITLKIKKMNMKKIPKFVNNVSFYYTIFNEGYLRFLKDDRISNSYIPDLNVTLKETVEYKSLMSNPQNTSMIYNINVIGDSSIIFYL